MAARYPDRAPRRPGYRAAPAIQELVMPDSTYETTAAFHELLDFIRDGDHLFLEGPRAATDDVSVLEGYRWLPQILAVALQCYVWADPAHPQIVPIVGPDMKWGGDNSDAYYRFAPIDPKRTYRVRGRRGDAVYLSLTVYGGPDDGRWSTRLVGTINDRTLDFDDEGNFEVVLGPDEHPGNWVRLDGDAVAVLTRDYLVDPVHDRQATWSIEVDGDVPPPRLTDVELAARFRHATNFLRELTGIFPIALDDTKFNTVDEPYAQPQVTYGWAAGDAAYAMGSFDLDDDQALVVEGRAPKCAFWNLCLWNPFLQTYDYRYEQVTINGGQVRYEPDGSWRVVIAARDPGVPNWVSTAGHRRGRIWFRWFLAESLPERPTARVVPVGSLAN
jgi:hypothetical protein